MSKHQWKDRDCQHRLKDKTWANSMLFTINSLWNVIGKFRSKEQKTYVVKHESKESWNVTDANETK